MDFIVDIKILTVKEKVVNRKGVMTFYLLVGQLERRDLFCKTLSILVLFPVQKMPVIEYKSVSNSYFLKFVTNACNFVANVCKKEYSFFSL